MDVLAGVSSLSQKDQTDGELRGLDLDHSHVTMLLLVQPMLLGILERLGAKVIVGIVGIIAGWRMHTCSNFASSINSQSKDACIFGAYYYLIRLAL